MSLIITPELAALYPSTMPPRSASDYVPMTFPAPVPDYSPEELAKIEAAKMKRARKKGA